MNYVALLRGINVGGNSKVDMKTLKSVFERAGMTAVKTYINSGNVIFSSVETDTTSLTAALEQAIEQQFGFAISVLLRTKDGFAQIADSLPASWTNDRTMKCDVMFLWDGIDRPDILQQLPINADIDEVRYTPGAVVWAVHRENASKSKITKLVGTPLYKQMTVRNCNTVRKLHALMKAVDDSPALR